MNVFIELLIFSFAGALRAGFGVFRNALADGVISPIEWNKIITTIVVTIALSVSAHYGFGLSEVEAASAVAGLLVLISEIKKALVQHRKKR